MEVQTRHPSLHMAADSASRRVSEPADADNSCVLGIRKEASPHAQEESARTLPNSAKIPPYLGVNFKLFWSVYRLRLVVTLLERDYLIWLKLASAAAIQGQVDGRSSDFWLYRLIWVLIFPRNHFAPPRPLNMPAPVSHQSLSLKFIIVGGSISGLTAAYQLRDSGHEVIILDKTDGKTKFFHSIQTGIELIDIGLSSISFRHADTSEPVGFMKFHEQIMAELRADFLILQAVDVKSSDGSVTVALENGKILRGDIVIGADGHNSLVRSIVAEKTLEFTHTVSGINISIPTRVVEEDEEFKSLCNSNEFTIWMGNGSSVVGTLDNNAEIFSLALCFPTPIVDVTDGDWHANHAVKTTVPFDYLSDYDPRLQKLIQLGYTCCPTIHRVFEQEDVVGLDGMVVLVGDAAHSALVQIHGSHNSSMAVEDAVTLGRLFSRLSNRRQIPLLLNAYREIRQPRTSATQKSEYESLLQISLPSGLLREARDAVLKATLCKAFEDFHNCEASDVLVQTWEQYLVLFKHDASEEVDNWWSMWGSVVEGAV
ncbi:hypothetical protein B0H17DRAFT_1181304 [Mycena rosella]|uniref:FAD/NAD(P)-binding domain-containing protein n=1 Tax=Mycena rosella TaxID=1033263 RepID=A0AAD7GFV1_MYCRO|nr:hypothetical protein B0H17DRAFT_1181304 [Mycena rosella]